jgi:hypothetical protein
MIPTTLKEAAKSKDNSTKSVGARAACGAGIGSRTDLVTKFNVSGTVRSAVN